MIASRHGDAIKRGDVPFTEMLGNNQIVEGVIIEPLHQTSFSARYDAQAVEEKVRGGGNGSERRQSSRRVCTSA